MQTAEAQKDAPKIEPVFDGDDVPAGKLDDAEIARLVSLSTQAAYHRTDNIPVKPKESFEPRTLVTIAMEAQRRREAELQASAAAQEAPSKDGAESADGSVNADTSDQAVVTGDTAAASPAVADTADAAASPTGAMGEEALLEAGEAEADEPELSEEEIAAAAVAEKLQAEYERGLAEGRAKGEEAGHKAGHDKGYEAGRAAGQAEATAQLETAIQGFEKATLALANTAALDLDALTASIHDAILSLASERAGMAIAEMPEAFAGRIESILATIKQGTEHPQISLNPDDFLALKPIIATREKLQNCSLAADETLTSGDLRLVINGIGIEDELQRRVSRKAAVQPADAPALNTSALDTPALDTPALDTPALDTAATDMTASPSEAETLDADADNTQADMAEPAQTAQTAQTVKSEDAALTGAGEGGFSIGLKPKTEAGDSTTPAADHGDATGTDY